MTPYSAQGANMGLEDAAVLVHALVPILTSSQRSDTSRHTDEITAALERVVQQRVDRVRAVHAQSRANALQSNLFDKDSARTPLQRRAYTKDFQAQLYQWKRPSAGNKLIPLLVGE